MIDISQYRFQIGLFRQKVFRKKFFMPQQFDNNTHCLFKSCFKMMILCMFFLPTLTATTSPGASSTWCPTATVPLSWSLSSRRQVTTSNWTDLLVGSRDNRVGFYTGQGTGNCWARYVYGKGSMPKRKCPKLWKKSIRGGGQIQNQKSLHFKCRLL